MADSIGYAGKSEAKTKFWQKKLVLETGLVPIYIPYMFLLPALILFIVFRYYPAILAIYHSFTIWEIPNPGEWVGLQNYQQLLSDGVFIQSVKNILTYTVGRTVLAVIMPFIAAELIYNLHNRSARNIWRMIFTVPIVIPISVELLIWKQVYAGRQGLLNQFLMGVGLIDRPQPWIADPSTALYALIFLGFPLVTGISFLVLLAALQNIPDEIKDAALLDGCTRLRRVFAIDIPAVRGALALVLVLGLNNSLQEFAPMLVVTQGGPVNATLSPGLYLYYQAFFYGEFGYATAIGAVLMLVTLVLSIIILWFRYRKAYDVTT